MTLKEYLKNTKKRNQAITFGNTPNALLAIGAKQLPIVMNPNDVDKCLSCRTANKNKNSHDLSISELNNLPKLLSNPVMIFKDNKNEGYITIVTDEFDKHGNPFVIGVELNFKQQKFNVNRIATMHARERAIESFLQKMEKKF